LVDGTGTPLGTSGNPLTTSGGGGGSSTVTLATGTANVGTFALSSGGTVATTGPNVTPAAGSASVVTTAGTAVAALTGPINGGILRNPIAGTGALYWNMVSAAGTTEGGTTFVLDAGDSINLPPLSTGVTLSVNAASNSYSFNLVKW
jgi:hypothetical protein